MKKVVFLIVCVLAFGMVQAQTVSKATVEQYRQLVKMNGQSFSTHSEKLGQWGFTFNKEGVINMFTMELRPFFRSEGQDTVAAMLGVMEETVYSTSGVVRSMEAARVYALIGKASAIQQELADEMGLTKYVCSVKGKKVTNKFPKSHAELVEVLEAMSAESVSMVYVQWKSADGKKTVTLIYDNKLFGKKKPRKTDRVEMTLGMAIVPEK